MLRRRAAAVVRVRVVDWRVFGAVNHSGESVEVYAYVVVGTDLAGTVKVASLHRRRVGDRSGIGVKRLDHQEVGIAGAVQKVGC